MAPSAPLHGKNRRFAVHTFQLEHQISLDIRKSNRQEDNLDYGGRDLNFAAPITKHATKFVEPAQHQSSMQLDRPNHEWKPREILGKEVVKSGRVKYDWFGNYRALVGVRALRQMKC